VKDYSRIHTYDSFGHPQSTSIKLDVTYVTTVGYDDWSRPITTTYTRGTDAPKVYDQRYNGYGYLYHLESSGQTLRDVTKQDAALRVRTVALGNGDKSTSDYNDYTALLTGATVQNSSGIALLTLGYQHDAVGNVTTRTQYWNGGAGFSETITYDELNRIWTSQVSGQGQQVFTYMAGGGILTKTGVGTGNYQYGTQGSGAVRPHAVKSIDGLAGIFTYDDNGNLLTGRGRTVTWTLFDMPATISNGTSSSTFAYGPERQRVRETRKDSVIVFADAQEVELATDGITVTSVKTYWPGGGGFDLDKPNQAAQRNWVHNDQLGSVVAITDGSGALKVGDELSYDVWGKRRPGTGAAPSEFSARSLAPNATDNKGFTGHEMLDQLDLVHMNGRVYDPYTAKFLSADPLVQDPTNGQNYNRYSYVLNNPTNMIDPTGFSGDCSGSKSGLTAMGCGSWKVVGDFFSYAEKALLGGETKADVAASVGSGTIRGPSGTDNENVKSQKSADKGVIGKAWDVVKGAAIGLVENAAADAHDMPMGGRGRELGLDMPTPREMCGGCDYKPGQVLPAPANAEQELGRDLAPIVSIVISGARRPSLSGLSFGQMRTALETAQEAYKGSTAIGHALSKHAGRNPQIWGRMSGAMKTWNAQAMTHFREIVRAPGEFQEKAYDGIKFLEKRLEDGRGIRLNMDSTFKGFID